MEFYSDASEKNNEVDSVDYFFIEDSPLIENALKEADAILESMKQRKKKGNEEGKIDTQTHTQTEKQTNSWTDKYTVR